MINAEVKIELYEIDGKDVITRDSSHLIAIRPHLRSDDSDFGGDSEHFCTLEIEGTSYTVCIGELLTALAAIQLVAKEAS